MRTLVYASGLFLLLVSLLEWATPERPVLGLVEPDPPNLRKESAAFVSQDTVPSGLRTLSGQGNGSTGPAKKAPGAKVLSRDSAPVSFYDPDSLDSSTKETVTPTRLESSSGDSDVLPVDQNLARSDLSPGPPVSLDSDLAKELLAFDRDYERTYHQLFNPFGFGVLPVNDSDPDPMEESSDENEPMPPSQENEIDDSGEDGMEDSQDESQGGGAGTETPSEPEPSEPVEEPAPEIFSFLVMADFSNAGGRKIFRANRLNSNRFVLENSDTLTLFPWRQQVVIFDQTKRPLSSDLNGDGRTDLVVGRPGGLGTGLESYIRTPRGTFEDQARGFLLHKRVRSFAAFDFDDDGEQELALILENNPRLVVYRQVNKIWEYAQEIVLPFVPSLAIAAQDISPPRLYLMDASLARVTYLTVQAGTVFLSPPFISYRPAVQSFEIRLVEGQVPEQVLVVNTGTQMLLAQRNGPGLDFRASFDIAATIPVVILGDYQRNSTRQIVFIP